MLLFRFLADDGAPHLGVEDETGGCYDVTRVLPDAFASLGAWLAQEDPVAAVLVALSVARDERRAGAAFFLDPATPRLAPVDRTHEVWAAGVTYERSKVARMEESKDAGGGDFYDRVYDAERPELFFKCSGWRAVGPGDPIRVREDSTWDVPEPEMTLVISSAGKVVGVTAGNDVCSRSIEGENPLYLPQGKIYDGCCALGPAIRLVGDGTEDAVDPANLAVRLRVARGGAVAFEAETSTARMKRAPQELADWLFRELTFPEGALMMTGTGIVPPDEFTLKRGDQVTITIEGVGTLANPVG